MSLNLKLISVLPSIYFAYLMLSVDSSRLIGDFSDVNQRTQRNFPFNCSAYVTPSEDCNQPDTCMYPYECNCSQYIHCNSINGPAYLRDCQPSNPPLHFHPATNRCDWSDNSLCEDDPDYCLQEPTTTTTPPSTTTVITTLMPTSTSPQPSTTTQFSSTASNATNNVTETFWTTVDDNVTETSTPSASTETNTPSTISTTLSIVTTIISTTSVTTAFTSTPFETTTNDCNSTEAITCGAKNLKTSNKLVYICVTVFSLFIILISLRI